MVDSLVNIVVMMLLFCYKNVCVVCYFRINTFPILYYNLYVNITCTKYNIYLISVLF